MKLAAAVILYNPDISVVDNISTYTDYVNEIIVIDNSEIQNIEIINKINRISRKVQYHHFGNNLGIATALNTAAAFALRKGFSHLLTMDQDSSFDKKNIMLLIKTADRNKKEKYAVIAPVFHLMTKIVKTIQSKSGILTEVKSVITSGGILNLESFCSAGGFIEKLFIDQVDHEFCLRARKYGYKTYILRDCYLNHKLGESEKVKFLFLKSNITNHSYVRRYYMTRNCLYLASHYWSEIPETIRKMTADNFKMIIFEKEKLKKIRSILLGVFDFLRGHYGKYNY